MKFDKLKDFLLHISFQLKTFSPVLHQHSNLSFLHISFLEISFLFIAPELSTYTHNIEEQEVILG